MKTFAKIVLISISVIFLGSCNEIVQRTKISNVTKMMQPMGISKDVLYCNIHSGNAKFDKSWQKFEPIDFSIKKGMNKGVNLFKKDREKKTKISTDMLMSLIKDVKDIGEDIENNDNLHVSFDEDGQKLSFCKLETDKNNCTEIYALEDDYYMGFKRSLDIVDLTRGSILSCKYNKR